MMMISRRTAFFGLTAPFLAACTRDRDLEVSRVAPVRRELHPLEIHYGERPDERFPLPAIDIAEIENRYLKQQVDYPTSEHVGTVVIDPNNRFLYLVQEGGTAMRYGVGVGKEGLAWNGRAYVGRKAMWPGWTPTADMIRRDPERNAKWAGGMQPGLQNPLGARALYLYRGGRDTMYRIHGTNEPHTIGQSLSSGCIRMFNQDVIDLYNRLPTGTTVVVLPATRFDTDEDELS